MQRERLLAAFKANTIVRDASYGAFLVIPSKGIQRLHFFINAATVGQRLIQ
jgi:hypothetical protein